MDPMDILGGLLGGGKKGSSGGSSGGLGGKILKDLLGGGRSRSAPSTGGAPAAPDRRRRSGTIEQQADELEDLLGVATGGTSSRPPAATPSGTPRRQPPSFDDVGSRYRSDNRSANRQAPSRQPQPEVSRNDEVLILVRAMINSAKADGRITDDEQRAILSRVADRSQSTIQFLQEEFKRPVDVREFAWSVPLGLEEKVYMLSLAAIDFDSNHEASYLADLAHGLRLEPDEVDAIHRQFGAPTPRR